MGRKLLFVMGIIIAHGALAAGWLRDEAPRPRASALSCMNTPGLPNVVPYFQPPRELLAMRVTSVEELSPSP